jgi:outer membrane protein OmpA-like peptidoglycan-associated protein
LYNEDAELYVGVTQTAYCSGVKLVNVTASVGIRVKFLPKVLPVPTPEIVDVFPDYVFIDEDIDIVVKEESIRIDRIADNYGVNLMPAGYNFVSNALDMSEQLRRKKVGDPIGAPILFASGSARLANTDNTIMDTVAVFLKENPDVKKLEVSAHTDNMGADAYNLNLSKRRAQTVANYLIKQGVEASRLKVEGYGKTRPLNNNETPEERERNRRVEFMILELSE